MDLDQLQSVRDRERQTDRLQQLRDSFYEEAAEFVQELRAEREEAAAAADDPFDAPRVTRLTDRIRTAEQTLEAIYEKRVGKVVKAATFAAADLPAEAEGMTREESELFETLVDEIEANRETVLGRLGDDEVGADVFGTGPDADGEEAAGSAADSAADGADGLGAADVMGEDPAAGEPDRTPPEPPDPPEGAPPEATDDAPATDDVAGSGDGPGGGGDAAGDGDGSPDSTANDPASGGSPDDPADATVDETDPAPPGPDGQRSDGQDPDGQGREATTATDGEPDGAPAAPAEGDVERELVRITDDVGPILGVDEREYDLSADDVVTLPAENARPLVERGVAERLE